MLLTTRVPMRFKVGGLLSRDRSCGGGGLRVKTNYMKSL